MPTISIDPNDFAALMGSEIDSGELERHLDLVKGEFKGSDPDGKWRVELNDTNRPDLWSAEGIARQLRAAEGRRRDYAFFRAGPAGKSIRVEAALEPVRPYVAAFAARGLEVTAGSLEQIIQTQEKLAENFGRHRADVAIGVYNLDKIEFPVHYLAVDAADHSYVPLGFDQPQTLAGILERHPKGIEYRHILQGANRVPLLRDASGMVLSMPPIINSRDVGEVLPGDSDLFVEATGNDLKRVILALNIMACDFADRGARIERIQTVFPYDTPFGREVDVPRRLHEGLPIGLEEFSRLLGVTITAAEADNVLERYGCDVSVDEGGLVVKPSPTRDDYLHPVDAVEDFAVARGYETFAPRMPREFSIGRSDPLSVLEDKVRDHMIGLGYEEVIANILTARAKLGRKMNLDHVRCVEIANVMNENYAVLRNAVLPSLLELEANSSAAAYPHRVFEAGEVAVVDEQAPTGSRTELHLGALLAHGEATFSEMHADAEYLFYQLGLDLVLSETEHSFLLPGRAARILVGGRPVGLLGEVHPEVLARWEIGVPAVALELVLDALP